MTHSTEQAAQEPHAPQAKSQFLLAIPFVLMVPIAFGALFVRMDVPVMWGTFGLGFLGWVIALLLRIPIQLLVRKLPKKRASTIIAAASGPCEELVRYGLLALGGGGLIRAASLGQGWAAVEVLYSLLVGGATIMLLGRDDEKARMVRDQLAEAGLLNASPFWGVLERLSATALHIGFTLVLLKSPLWLIFTVPAHSALNLIAVGLMKRSLLKGQLVVAAAGAVIFLTGLMAAGLFS